MVAESWPEWAKLHRSYFGSRFTEDQYQHWSRMLTREAPGTPDMLKDAVNEMIRSGFSGYLEDHFKYLREWVSRRVREEQCELCSGRGYCTVPYHGHRLNVKEISVACRCNKRHSFLKKHPNAASIDEYEKRRGTGWRQPGTQRELEIPSEHDVRRLDAMRDSIGERV